MNVQYSNFFHEKVASKSKKQKRISVVAVRTDSVYMHGEYPAL